MKRFRFCLLVICAIGSLAGLKTRAADSNQSDNPSITPETPRLLFESGREGYLRYRIPTLIVTRSGDLLAICEGRADGGGLTGNVDLVCKRSRDNGRTWSGLKVIGESGEDTFGNQSALVDRDTGIIWVACTVSPGEHLEQAIAQGETEESTRVFVFFSEDDGETWSSPRDITSSVKRSDWTWYGCGPGVGLQLADGRLFFAAYHREGENGQTVRSHAIFSDDHGKTWQLGGSAGIGNGEPQALQREDGSLYLSARTKDGPHVRSIVESTDGGETWSKKRFDHSLYDAFCQASLLKLPPRVGQPQWLYCHPAGPGRRDLTVRLSDDEGRTWTAGSLLLQEGNSQYSSMALLNDGRVGVLFDLWENDNYQLYFTTFAADEIVRSSTDSSHAASADFSQKSAPPNVLLILSDDHSVPHVSCYGDPNTTRFRITPNLQAFAEQGMRFDRAYTSAPQCAPSRISIFACRSPVGLGVTRFAQPPRGDVRFFTDVLRDNGYWVGLDGRHQHLDGRVREAAQIDRVLQAEGMQNLPARFDHFVRSAGTKGAGLQKVPDRVAAALDKVPDGKPFFLYFGFNQPHRRFGTDHSGIDPEKLVLPPDWPDLPEVRIDYARYLSDLSELDQGFGSIMKLLDQRGLTKNTLVIFMGDNGEALFRGKGTLHDRGTHVPLMIRWPGRITAGSSSDALVCGTDLGPTILTAAGLKPLKLMTGVSFLPELLSQEFTSRRHVFAERGWHWGPITRTDGLDLSRSVTSRRYRYIYNALPGRSYTPVDMPKTDAWNSVKTAHAAGRLSPLHNRLFFQNPRPIIELYDLQEDPYELNNLAGSKKLSDVETTLREELEAWMIREHDFLPLPTHALQNVE